VATIVVGYDDGAPAQHALERALEEAKERNAHLVVVSVLELPLDPSAPRNFGTLGDGPAARMPAGLPPELEPVVAHAHERVAAAGLRADFVWAAGDPAEALIEAAQERNASLVVLGEHHRGLFAALVGADVPGEVERRSGANVLVVD
jgi:nucleotide-binding universal stress UspA family protein